MFYISIMVIIKQKFIIDTQKLREKKQSIPLWNIIHLKKTAIEEETK